MQTAELHVQRVSWARDATTRSHSTLTAALLLTRIRSPCGPRRARMIGDGPVERSDVACRMSMSVVSHLLGSSGYAGCRSPSDLSISIALTRVGPIWRRNHSPV